MRYIFLVFTLWSQVYGQTNPGPRYTAMGSGGVALHDIWSLQQNPAGIAGSKRPMLAFGYQQHLIDRDLSTQTALFIFPYRQNIIGFSVERYGFAEYSEQNAGLAYARKFGESFRLAIGVKYHQLNITRYGSASAFTVEAGFQLNITDDLIVASHLANPSQSRFEELSNSDLPVRLSIGVSYKFSDKVLMVTDIRKILNYPLDVISGIEYNIIKNFSLRGGLSANPFKQYAGFGLNYNKLRIDAAVASHPDLGYTPQIAFGYEF